MESWAEIDRIRGVYRQYLELGLAQSKWSTANRGNLLNVWERENKMRALLEKTGFFPLSSKRILDVGCGDGQLLQTFRDWGAQEDCLSGVDLIPARIRMAQQTLPRIRFEVANAESLPFATASFHLISVFTVFSSILAPQMSHNIASEITRVLRPGGAILWYDFRFNNPWNKNVRGVSREAIDQLFPGFESTLSSISLLPPLARRLGGLTEVLYKPLSSFPFLRSHLLGLLAKS